MKALFILILIDLSPILLNVILEQSIVNTSNSILFNIEKNKRILEENKKPTNDSIILLGFDSYEVNKINIVYLNIFLKYEDGMDIPNNITGYINIYYEDFLGNSELQNAEIKCYIITPNGLIRNYFCYTKIDSSIKIINVTIDDYFLIFGNNITLSFSSLAEIQKDNIHNYKTNFLEKLNDTNVITFYKPKLIKYQKFNFILRGNTSEQYYSEYKDIRLILLNNDTEENAFCSLEENNDTKYNSDLNCLFVNEKILFNLNNSFGFLPNDKFILINLGIIDSEMAMDEEYEYDEQKSKENNNYEKPTDLSIILYGFDGYGNNGRNDPYIIYNYYIKYDKNHEILDIINCYLDISYLKNLRNLEQERQEIECHLNPQQIETQIQSYWCTAYVGYDSLVTKVTIEENFILSNNNKINFQFSSLAKSQKNKIENCRSPLNNIIGGNVITLENTKIVESSSKSFLLRGILSNSNYFNSINIKLILFKNDKEENANCYTEANNLEDSNCDLKCTTSADVLNAELNNTFGYLTNNKYMLVTFNKSNLETKVINKENPEDSKNKSKNSGLSRGKIIAIIISCVAVLIIILTILVLVFACRKKQNSSNQDIGNNNNNTIVAMGSSQSVVNQ